MTVKEWKDRYQQAFQLLHNGFWTDVMGEYHQITKPMTETVWKRFTQQEQQSILNLAHQLYEESLK